jgi:hypothetical protein
MLKLKNLSIHLIINFIDNCILLKYNRIHKIKHLVLFIINLNL